MHRSKFVLLVAVVVSGSMLGIAACGSSSNETATTSSSTTSTTLAIALPADQVSMQGRGTLTLTELGVGWTLDPTTVNDSGPAEQTGGLCNGANLNARMAGNVGQSAYGYLRQQPTATDFSIYTYVFPTVDAARAAFARTAAAYNCNNWTDPKTKRDWAIAVLPELREPCNTATGAKNSSSASGLRRKAPTSTTIPACPAGDESLARRVTTATGANTTFCNKGQVGRIADEIEMRIGAQVFRYVLGTIPADSSGGCDGTYPNAPAPDTGLLFMLTQQAINKYRAELKQYTKEYYSTLATSTTTGKGATSTTKAK